MAPLVADDRGVEAREDGHHGGLRGGGFPDETGRGGAAGRVHQSGGGLGGGARACIGGVRARAFGGADAEERVQGGVRVEGVEVRGWGDPRQPSRRVVVLARVVVRGAVARRHTNVHVPGTGRRHREAKRIDARDHEPHGAGELAPARARIWGSRVVVDELRFVVGGRTNADEGRTIS